MKKNRIITWFIFTNDAHTNRVISTEIPSENMHHNKMCFDDIQRNLWECDGQFVTKIIKCKSDQHLRFHIYKREGKYGPITKADFLKTSKKKLVRR